MTALPATCNAEAADAGSLRTMRSSAQRRGLVALLLVAALALTGCTAQEPASPTATTGAEGPLTRPKPSQTPKSTPVSPPAPEGADVRDVVVTATAIEVRDENGELVASYDYFQPTEEVVAGLSSAFGAAPVSSPYPGGNHDGPGTNHEWGGFRLVDTDAPGQAPHFSNHHVSVATQLEGGVRISTTDGIMVGDDATALEAAHPETSMRSTVIGQPERTDIFVGHAPLPNLENGPASVPLTFSVWLIAFDPDAGVSEFRAPSPNFGA